MPNTSLRHASDEPHPVHPLHTAYFLSMILAALGHCDVIRDHLKKLPAAKTQRERKLLQEEIAGSNQSVRDFLQNVSVVHGVKPWFKEDGLEQTFFRM